VSYSREKSSEMSFYEKEKEEMRRQEQEERDRRNAAQREGLQQPGFNVKPNPLEN
jgi:hypothetical protein